MNSDRLFALYDRVADAPDAVSRLRRFVLDLAVRGKLVEQDPADEPASELLRRIAAEKARRVNVGRTGRKKAVHPEMAPPPFNLPRTWRWASLGAVFQYDAGTQCDPKALDSSGWLLELQDIEKGTGRLLDRVRTSERKSKSTKSQFLPGDILYGKLRPYLNKVLVADETGYSTTEIVAIRPYLQLSSEYCALALRRPDFVDYVTRLGQGTKMPRLRTKDAVVAPFPLPPLAEQRRIVAKVDELLALCDQLEETRTAREDTRDRLTKASLTRLSAADTDVPTFRSHARFAVDALPALTARTDQVKHLRQTILSLAVRGKLVEQDQSDEPVGSLLAYRAIRASDSQWFEIPATWAWVSVRAVAKSRLGKMLDKSKNTGAPRRYLRNVNVRWFNFDLSDVLEMRFEDAELPEFALRAGDVLICEGGEPGRAAVWDEREDDIYFQKAIHRVRFLDIVDGQYFVNALRASADEGRLAEYFTGTTIKHFTGTALRAYVFPLPPLAEQRRIVAKVDELMTLCDELEAGLDAAGGTRSLLLDSLLHESLGSHVAVINGKTGGVTRIGT